MAGYTYEIFFTGVNILASKKMRNWGQSPII